MATLPRTAHLGEKRTACDRHQGRSLVFLEMAVFHHATAGIYFCHWWVINYVQGHPFKNRSLCSHQSHSALPRAWQCGSTKHRRHQALSLWVWSAPVFNQKWLEQKQITTTINGEGGVFPQYFYSIYSVFLWVKDLVWAACRSQIIHGLLTFQRL